MWKGANSSKFNYILVVLIKNTIEYLCLFIKIKCAVKSCAFDFFYTLKEKHCRSPPPISSKKLNWLEEREMQENAKCFIRIDKGIFEEITYKELEKRRKLEKEYNMKKFIPIDGMLLEVTENEYKDFYKDFERNKYIMNESKRFSFISINKMAKDDDDKDIRETIILPDENVDINAELERKMEIE